MSKVCRLCLVRVESWTEFFHLNAVEPNSGFMPFRDQLQTCMPEIALDLIPNPIICQNCQLNLKQAHEFKTKCLEVEERIRNHISNQPLGEEYDLTPLAVHEKGHKIEVHEEEELGCNEVQDENVSCNEIHDEEDDSFNVNTEQSGTDEDVVVERKQITKNVIQEMVFFKEDPDFGGPPEQDSMPKAKRTRRTDYLQFRRRNRNSMFVCNYENCQRWFPTRMQLNCHKLMHPEFCDYKCNFCNSEFRSLQQLRQHNSKCTAKIKAPPVERTLKKRPHLPNRAKCYLKRWLYKHTDRPYPTDQEKQQLMQETNLTLLQVENWFINARRRILQDLTRLKEQSAKRPVDMESELDLDDYIALTKEKLDMEIKQEKDDEVEVLPLT